MNEAERLAYLGAIGVDSYVPRINLPGALPSVLCDDSVLVEASLSGMESADQPGFQLKAGKSPLAGLQESLAGKKLPDAKLRSPAFVSGASSAPVVSQMNVRFHWSIFQPVAEMLLLVPVAHTESNHIDLLGKILAAIGITMNSPAPLESFIWPPANQVVAGRTSPNASVNDARETLQALLEGYQLKQRQQNQFIRYILVFDEDLGKTLFDNDVLFDMRLFILPSLALMSNNTPEKVSAAKKVTWQKLKELKPA